MSANSRPLLSISDAAFNELKTALQIQLRSHLDRVKNPSDHLKNETNEFVLRMIAALDDSLMSRDPDLTVWAEWLGGVKQNPNDARLKSPRGRSTRYTGQQFGDDLARSNSLKANALALEMEAQEKLRQAEQLRHRAAVDDAFILQHKLRMLIDQIAFASRERFAMGYAWFFVDAIADAKLGTKMAIRDVIAAKMNNPAFRAQFLELLTEFCRKHADSLTPEERLSVSTSRDVHDEVFDYAIMQPETFGRLKELLNEKGLDSALEHLKDEKSKKGVSRKKPIREQIAELDAEERSGILPPVRPGEMDTVMEGQTFDPMELEESERQLSSSVIMDVDDDGIPNIDFGEDLPFILPLAPSAKKGGVAGA